MFNQLPATAKIKNSRMYNVEHSVFAPVVTTDKLANPNVVVN